MNYNCNNVSVTFPLTIKEASYTKSLRDSILGSSYIIFKPYGSDQTVLFKSKTAIVDVDGAFPARVIHHLYQATVVLFRFGGIWIFKAES